MSYSPRSTRPMSARPSSARPEQLVENFFRKQAMFGYDVRDHRKMFGSGMDPYAYWQKHALEQNLKQVRAATPGSPRARAPPASFRSSSPRFRQTGYSPRSFELGTATMFPPFVDPLPKPAKVEVEEEVEEEVVEEEIVDVGPTRKHGELPPGVVPNDLRRMATLLKDKLIDKCGSMQKAFRMVDKDGSGSITSEELWKGLETLNLHHGLREDVFTALFETIDADASGSFDYKEFARVLSASDVMNMVKIADKVDGHLEEQKKIAAQEYAVKEMEAKRAGMTVEEYEKYWSEAMGGKKFSQMTSAEMAQNASKGTRTGLQARGR